MGLGNDKQLGTRHRNPSHAAVQPRNSHLQFQLFPPRLSSPPQWEAAPGGSAVAQGSDCRGLHHAGAAMNGRNRGRLRPGTAPEAAVVQGGGGRQRKQKRWLPMAGAARGKRGRGRPLWLEVGATRRAYRRGRGRQGAGAAARSGSRWQPRERRRPGAAAPEGSAGGGGDRR